MGCLLDFVFAAIFWVVIVFVFWTLAKAVFHAIFGVPSATKRPIQREPRNSCPACGAHLHRDVSGCWNCNLNLVGADAKELERLAITEEQLHKLLESKLIRPETFAEAMQGVADSRARVIQKCGAIPRKKLETGAIRSQGLENARYLLEQYLAGGKDPQSLKPEVINEVLDLYSRLSDDDLAKCSSTALRALARLLQAKNLNSEAIRVFRRLLDRTITDGDTSEAFLEAGCLAVQEKQWEQARWFLERAATQCQSPSSRLQALELFQLCAPHLTPAPPPLPPPQAPIPLSEPPRPRRTVGEMLAAFMEERNIFWGELVGGLLMVGCSIALVISLWHKLEQIPYFPFLIFAAVTVTVYAVGSYTLHHWKLESTSRGLLVIATLLVPLNLLVLAGLSRGRAHDILDIGVEVLALAIFGYVVFRAAQILVPAGTTSLTLAVLGPAAGQLLAPRLLQFREPTAGMFVGLGLLPLVLYGAGCARFLFMKTQQTPLQWLDAKAVFTFLGTSSFAVGVALGLLVIWHGDMALALELLAVPLAAAGIPALAAGLHLQRRLADDPALAGTRTAATALALAGASVMVLAFLVAWPAPAAMTLVALLDFAVLTVVAGILPLPMLHAISVLFLAAGCVTGFHWLTGRLDVDIDQRSARLLAMAVGSMSETILAIVAVALAIASEWFVAAGRRMWGGWYAIGCGEVAAGALMIALAHLFVAPGSAALICSVCAFGCLALNTRWLKQPAGYAGFVLWSAAVFCVALWFRPESPPFLPTVMAVQSFILAVLAAWGHWRARSPAPRWLAAYAPVCRDVALVTGGLAVTFGGLVGDAEAIAASRVTLAALAAAALVLAGQYRSFLLAGIGATVTFAAIGHIFFIHGPALPRSELALLTFLSFGTASLTANAAISAVWSRRSTVESIYCDSFQLAARIAKCAAILFLLTSLGEGAMGRLALYSVWLSFLWLITIWLDGWLWGFTIFQALLTLAVALAVCARLESLPWFVSYAESFTDPRFLQSIAIGLALLGFFWALSRALLRNHRFAQSLLESAGAGLDWFVLTVLVVGQLAIVAGSLVPQIVREVIRATSTPPPPIAWVDALAIATGPAAWLLAGILAVVLVLTFWERCRPMAIAGFVLVGLTIPVLIAGQYRSEFAAANMLRWGLAWSLAALSIVFWSREPLASFAVRLNGAVRGPADAGALGRMVLLAGAVVPICLLSLVRLVVELTGKPSWGPEIASPGPIVVIAAVLAGFAVREQAARYTFAAGLAVNLAATLAVARIYLPAPLATWIVPLAQVNAIVAALLALGWLEWRQWHWTRRDPLMGLQVAIPVACNCLVLFWSLYQIVLFPSATAALPILQAGQLLGWVAFLLSATAVVWQVQWQSPERATHVFGGTFVFLGVLAACTIVRWDRGGWWAYHVIAAAAALAGLMLAILGWGRKTRRTATADWLARTLAAQDVRRWVVGLGTFLAFLALRGTWSDPARPYAPVAATIAACVLFGLLALSSGIIGYSYVSGLLITVAGFIIWQSWLIDEIGIVTFMAWGPGITDRLLFTIALTAAVASIVWTLLALDLQPDEKNAPTMPFHHAGMFVAVNVMAMLIVGGLAGDLTMSNTRAVGPLAWLAMAATIIALTIARWDASARFVPLTLFACGLLAIGLLLHGQDLAPAELCRRIAVCAAAYLFATAAVRWLALRHQRLWWRLRVPEIAAAGTESIDLTARATSAAAAAALAVWCSLDLAGFADRLSGATALLLLTAALMLLAGSVSLRWVLITQFTVVALAVTALAAVGWAIIGPEYQAVQMHRAVIMLGSIVGMLGLVTRGLPRLLPKENGWHACFQKLSPALIKLTAAAMLLVLLLEFLNYVPDPGVRRTPMAIWGFIVEFIAIIILITRTIGLAVAPDGELVSTVGKRQLAVYAAEILVALLLVHTRLNVPQLFPQINARMWPFVAMAIAYSGAGLSAYFERSNYPVFAGPLRQTGVFLPLLPLVGFWARPPAALYEFATSRLPGMLPFLDYLDRLPHNFADHALIWALVGMLYAFVAVVRQSTGFALAAALAGNFGLWAFWHHSGLLLIIHPQLWLIPIALIILAAEQVNRDRLPTAHSATLRYFGLLLLYVSSTADMFISGLGNSAILPIVLALLAVLGVLAGILLHVRAFMLMGFAFLFLDVFSMIWHAAVDRYQTWIWWASGIVLGAAIIALFAVFEKRRNDVLRVIEEVKSWR